MTVASEAPPVSPAAETQPAPPAAPAAPAQQQPAVPAPPAQQQAPAQQAPAVPQPPAQPPPASQQEPAQAPETDWKAEAERLRSEADEHKRLAEQWKAQSRRQEARSKANHEDNKNLTEILRQVADKVGVEWDSAPDPEVLQARLTEQTNLARQRAVELAVYTTAATSGVNASALLDSREFMARTAQLDPEAVDFTGQVAELVREAASQPRYQFQQPPRQETPAPVQQAQPPAPQPPAQTSGADFSGSPGDGPLWTQATYDQYMANAHIHDRDGSKLAKAIEDGLLVNLGVGRPKQRRR